MKKYLYMCICMLALLMGCGNKMSNVNTDMATRETTDSEKDDVNVWSHKVDLRMLNWTFVLKSQWICVFMKKILIGMAIRNC